MSYPVFWSQAAKDELADLLAYVEANFGTEAALKLLDKADRLVEHIGNFPNAFVQSKAKPHVHKAVLTAQTSIFFHFTNGEVVILHFWDNRQDPDHLNEFL